MNTPSTKPTTINSILEAFNVSIMTVSYVGLFLSGFINNLSYNQTVAILGWIIWIGGLLLAFTPNIVFKKRGGVPAGKSYVHTTQLVTDGIFSVVRHPQYTGGIVIALAVCLIIQHPITYILALIGGSCAYISMIFEEKRLIRKFGTPYQIYMKQVPRANFILGLWRKVKNS